MRAGLIEEADETMKRWSIDIDKNQVTSHNMENTWYSLLTAKAFWNKGKFIDAFKYLNIIE